MASVSIRDLSRNTSRVVEDVASTGRPALVTRHGAPVAAVVPIDTEKLEDFVLANSPDVLASLKEADDDLAAGRTRSAAEVFDSLGD